MSDEKELKENLFRKIAIESGIYDCICDPYDKLKNGDPQSSILCDLERYGCKILEEALKEVWYDMTPAQISEKILEKFGLNYFKD